MTWINETSLSYVLIGMCVMIAILSKALINIYPNKK
ncbi:MAG: hypothetical protein UV80_C0006G0034 [Candidatus Peregrinibacteria bacterium GW2011_GWF2_43_17]|nr:MAG: hypothetical protein UV80_C0006G0034 [Candidatus Peregrinibacteria bacterium GW2011_GWF2_43_17]